MGITWVGGTGLTGTVIVANGSPWAPVDGEGRRPAAAHSAGLYPSPSAALRHVWHTVIMVSQHCGETTW